MLRGPWLLLLASGVVVWCGCQRIAAPAGLLEQSIPHAHLTSQKLRTLVTDYVPRFTQQTEEAADKILAEASDPLIRRQALLWKSQGIAACFRAAARPDALAALIDIWILTRQSTDFFERGGDPPPLGPWQNLAIETSRRLEEPLVQIHATLGEDTQFGEKFVADFAARHPLTSLYYDRASVANEYIESVHVPNPELISVVGGLNESVADMRKLSTLYADFLAKQARWQAELLLIDVAGQEATRAALGDVALAAQAADRLARTAEALPAMISQERAAAIEALADERQATLAEIDRMRQATLVTVREERTAILAALRQERELTGAAIQQVLNESIQSADRTVAARAEQASLAGRELLDRSYRRGLQLAMIAAVVLLSLATLRFLNRRAQGVSAPQHPSPRDDVPRALRPRRRPVMRPDTRR